ncbi:MAG: TIGR04255 family protein [Bryobacterales bacterium]|nr:TIGR04255 family protein [Bryobacterales bacterium]
MSVPVTALPPFPESERVVYRRNPLMEVICQLRFPPVLKISEESPVAFQDLIRDEYPLLTEKFPEVNVEIPPGIPPALAEMVRGTIPKRKLVGYDFVTADEKWKVSLTRDFLSLATTEYTRWEDFRQHLNGPLDALMSAYRPAFFTRIGLRYQDLIQRSILEIPETTKWSELIKPHISGVHAVPELDGAVEEFMGQLLIRLPEFNSKVRVNYGVAQRVDSNEDCFLIDSDYHTGERTRYDAVGGILDYFNKQSGRLFRWCIKPELHQAMDPHFIQATS